MKKAGAVLLGIAAFAAIPALAHDDEGTRFGGNLVGYNETPQTLSTTGHGRFDARIDERNREIRYQLSYGDLEGTVTQAHIHLGRPATTGGISAFFCTNLGNGPVGTQACPQPTPGSDAMVSGTITPADVIGPAGQGISAGEWDELVAAIRATATYANVHTTKYPGGEIRTPVRRGHSRGGDRD